jgi:xanthine dehydrogenase accessory factor
MNIWSFIRSKLEAGNRICLLVVIQSSGSSPGRAGFKMAVSADGELSGSVGGGVMEYKLVELARKQFLSVNPAFILKQDHEQTGTGDSSGMICSGKQYVAFYPLIPANLPGILDLTESPGADLIFDENGIQSGQNHSEVFELPFISEDLKKWKLVEKVGIVNRLFIIGGGHVSVAVSKLFKMLDFQITVLDDRSEELSSIRENIFADEIRIIDYAKVANYIPDGTDIFVVIMTFGHRSDARVLELLLHKNIRYLGMMGSERKVHTIFEDLRSKGVSEERLNMIDAPIGLPINSQTPMEIAVSLAGKVILVKNGG